MTNFKTPSNSPPFCLDVINILPLPMTVDESVFKILVLPYNLEVEIWKIRNLENSI